MSDVDYTKIERPIEPAFANEGPEQWCEVLAWEEARADALDERVEELEKLFYLIKKDLLQRSEKDSDGVSVVGLSHSLWLEVKAVSDAWENK